MFFEKKTRVSNFFTRCKYEQNSARSPPCSILAAPNSHKTVTQIMASRSPGIEINSVQFLELSGPQNQSKNISDFNVVIVENLLRSCFPILGIPRNKDHLGSECNHSPFHLDHASVLCQIEVISLPVHARHEA